MADKLSEGAVESLRQLGATVILEPALSAAELPAAIGNAEVLIVRSTKITRETIENATNLSLIVRAGAGVNTIDLDAASGRGIYVANCPGKNAAAVAELTMGLIIAADRGIADSTADLRNGTWNKKLYSKAVGLKGRRFGLVGLGFIGREVALRAASFGMHVVAWSPSLTMEKASKLGVEFCATLADVAAQSDVVSVHVAAGKDTKNLIDGTFLKAMKDGAIFVNTSRGEIVDTAALKTAIEKKGIKAALDVYENEPGSGDGDFSDTDLARLVVGTHHIGASTEQASEAIAEEVVRIVAEYVASGKSPNLVNGQQKSVAQYSLVIRHYNRVGVLAGVLDELRTAKINVEEMENSIFSGGMAAVCTMKLDHMPNKSLIDRIVESPLVIQVAHK